VAQCPQCPQWRSAVAQTFRAHRIATLHAGGPTPRPNHSRTASNRTGGGDLMRQWEGTSRRRQRSQRDAQRRSSAGQRSRGRSSVYSLKSLRQTWCGACARVCRCLCVRARRSGCLCVWVLRVCRVSVCVCVCVCVVARDGGWMGYPESEPAPTSIPNSPSGVSTPRTNRNDCLRRAAPHGFVRATAAARLVLTHAIRGLQSPRTKPATHHAHPCPQRRTYVRTRTSS
jgi:hypothetical protein